MTEQEKIELANKPSAGLTLSRHHLSAKIASDNRPADMNSLHRNFRQPIRHPMDPRI
jgi:hypothetical protein